MELREILLDQPGTSTLIIVSLLSLALVLLYWINVCCQEDTKDTKDRADNRIFINTLLLGLSSGSGAVLTTSFYQVSDNSDSIFVKASLKRETAHELANPMDLSIIQSIVWQ